MAELELEDLDAILSNTLADKIAMLRVGNQRLFGMVRASVNRSNGGMSPKKSR